MPKRKLRKIIRTTVLVVLAIIVLLALYWAVIAPPLTQLWSARDKYYFKGAEYFLNETYLEFEGGAAFCEVVECLGKPEDGQIVNFVYADNRIEDNPFYGKKWDVYTLEFVLPPEEYQTEKMKMEESGAVEGIEGDYTLYALSEAPSNAERLVVIGFCDEIHTVRYIMEIERDGTDVDPNFGTGLWYRAGLEWSVSGEK